MMTSVAYRVGQYAVALLTAIVLSSAALAQNFGTAAERAILVDVTAGQILFEKNSDIPFPPASMSKLMTLYVAFDAIRAGEMSLDDQVIVSDEAWRAWNNRGSTMFLGAGDEVTVLDLIRGIIVLSGNDACVVLAEHMAGTHELFVEWMNAAATEIGLKDSVFKNANGWPAEGHVMSARDLATLSTTLSRDFPDLYPLFSEREYQYKNYSSNRFNRNPLLGRFAGADGLKTGHTEESGYGLAASAERDGRRLVLVIGGLQSKSERTRESGRILQYGFKNFRTYPLFRAGEVVERADIWLGKEGLVDMVLAEDLRVTLTRRQRSEMTVEIRYVNPMPAPVVAGAEVGSLTITVPGMDPISYPLLAKTGIERVSGFGKIGAALSYLLFGSAGTAKN